MQNVKYHILNITSMLVFSFVTSLTINQIVKYTISPLHSLELTKMKRSQQYTKSRDFEYYQSILDSGFFKIAAPNVQSGGIEGGTVSSAGDLTLLGTISGPPSIARALIQKRGDQNPKIFALYKVSNEVSNDVYGYKLVGIQKSKVYLKSSNEQCILDVFPKGESKALSGGPVAKQGGQIISQKISRAELQQKISKNMDNMLQGIAGRPYNVGGVIGGFQMVRIPPNNMLYELGIRSGDIIKRINNHPIDSTEKLLQLWNSLMNESKIRVDLERQNQVLTLDFTLTD